MVPEDGDAAAAVSKREVTYSCGYCGYALNLSSSNRDTTDIGSKYKKTAKKGVMSFFEIDESRFISKDSWGLLRRKTKLFCQNCKNRIGSAYVESSPPSGSDTSDAISVDRVVRSRKYNIKISALQPSSDETVAESSQPSDQSVLIGSGTKFSYCQVLRMTTNFNKLIGEGGFGKVYEGLIGRGTHVAVKMLKDASEDNMQQFKNEVKLLMSVLHENLVPFYGYCDDGANMALICEYMAGGDLEDYISTESKRAFLTWEKRLQIALGIARGLEYLHNEQHIVHRDLKPANILLSERLEPKIADFGFGRIFKEENVTHVVTKVVGTRGYLDLEYFQTNMASFKSDVYSFGVILLQLITSKPAIIVNPANDVIHLTAWVQARPEPSNVVDPRLGSEYHTMSVSKAICTAEQCTLQDRKQRPVMSKIVPELETCLNIERARGATAR